jgi:Tol biopolymer transport system component
VLAPEDEAPRSPSWARDGEEVLYLGRDGARARRLDGGPAEPRITPPSVGALAQVGGRLLLRLDGGERSRLAVAPADAPTALSGCVAGGSGALSPDGKRLLFRRPDGLYVEDLGAPEPPRLLSAGEHAAWSPDGARLVIAGGRELFVLRSDGGGATSLVTFRGDDDGPDYPYWSRDGFIYFSGVAGDRYDLFRTRFVGPHADGAPRPPTPLFGIARGTLERVTSSCDEDRWAQPSSDGKRLLVARRAANGTRLLAQTGDSERSVATLRDGAGAVWLGTRGFAYSDGGELLRAGERAPEILFSAEALSAPVLAPDGQHLLVGRREGDDWQVVRVDLRHGGVEKLTAGGAPALSPDGKRLVVQRHYAGRERLYWVSLDDGEESLLSKSEVDLSSPSWSPDGRELALVACGGGACELWSADMTPQGAPAFMAELAAAARAQPITHDCGDCRSPRFGADGWLYFSASVDGVRSIYRWRR